MNRGPRGLYNPAHERDDCAGQGLDLTDEGACGVGMMFLPSDTGQRRDCEGLVERMAREEGARFLGWRGGRFRRR
ncbi:MAG: hypothetical protein ISR64_09265 [Deltaproteobacteria bacterium]|nr:hypothetical protein [Deltaproteobacteria bacterium]